MNDIAKQETVANDVPVENATANQKKETHNEDGKPTIGEELFLVHLHRHTSEDDFDRDSPPRKERSRSAGEELWEVHVKRSQGMKPDFDVEPSHRENKSSSPTKGTRKAHSKTTMKKPERGSERLAKVMHLRNRDVKKMLVR